MLCSFSLSYLSLAKSGECGTKNDDGGRFCSECGAALPGAAPAPAAAGQPDGDEM